MGEGADDLVTRGTRRIFGPPCEDMRPHADDGLGEYIRVEACLGATFGNGFATANTHAMCQTFEDPRTDLGRFCAGVKDDPKQLSLVLGETDKGFGLRLDDLDWIRFVFGDSVKAQFQFGCSVLGEFTKKSQLVFEVKVESAGGVAGLLRDRVARDGVGSEFGEEPTSGVE